MEDKKLSLEELNVIDAFSLFGVSENATNEEIKKAYYKIASLYHPDINEQDQQADEKMQIVNVAYENIKDEEARTNYKRITYNQQKRAYEDFCRNKNQKQTTHQNATHEENKAQRTPNETKQNNQEITLKSTNQEEDTFEEFLKQRGNSYREVYEMYFNELMSLEVEITDQKSMNKEQRKQAIRKLAVEYADNYVNQVSTYETNRSK